MILPAFLTFAAASLLADLGGWGTERGWLWTVCLFLALSTLPERAWRYVFGALLAASVAVAAEVALQKLVIERPHGPFASPNFLGWWAVSMGFVALLRGCPNLAVMNVGTALLSGSRASALAIVAGALCFLPKKLILPAIGLVGAAAIWLWPHDPRLSLWRVAFRAGMDRPLTGWGHGGFAIWSPGSPKMLTHFYSTPLDLFCSTGLLGLAAASFLIFVAAQQAARIAGTAGTQGVLSHIGTSQVALAFLAAWCVNSLFLSAVGPAVLPLIAVLAWLVGRDVPDVAVVIDRSEPVLDRGVRA